jgi:hypothetical protein
MSAKSRVVSPFYCGVCEMAFNDNLSLATHLSGQKHRAKAGLTESNQPDPTVSDLRRLILQRRDCEQAQQQSSLHCALTRTQIEAAISSSAADASNSNIMTVDAHFARMGEQLMLQSLVRYPSAPPLQNRR